MADKKLFILGLIVVGIFGISFFRLPKLSEPVKENDNNSALIQVLSNSLAGTKGTYGVMVKNLSTGEMGGINQERVFETGSLYKLWVMAETFKQINSGLILPDELLIGNVSDLNQEFGVPDEFADLSDGTVSLTVTEALTQMITISHNYAALLLTKKVQPKNLDKWFDKIDGSPVSTPQKTTQFLEELYRGKIIDATQSAKMIDLLKKQKLNDGLPKYLPKSEAIVAHKTGTLGKFQNDAGIVFTPTGDYIIAVFSESDSVYGAEERISLLSKSIYDYFSTKNTNAKTMR